MHRTSPRFALLPVALATVLLMGGGTFAAIATDSLPAALAQDAASPAPGAPPQGGHGRMGKALMSLNLSDAQKTQIRGIMADVRKQNETVTDRDQKHANYKAAMTKVEAVLTPAQRTELHTKMDAVRAPDQTGH